MKYNLRVESKTENAASVYTWRNVHCQTIGEAYRTALNWAIATDEEHSRITTVKYSIWFPTDKELDEEDHERAREKAEFELFAGGYNDSL